MKLTRRQQWMLFAGAATAIAAPLAAKAISAAWRQATGEEPPDDSSVHDMNWGKVALWTVSSAVVTGLAQVAARQAAAVAWKGVHGEAPPRPSPTRRGKGLRAFA